ncbi:MAG: hypothetical protein KZQ64_13635 [gamma proteobacterium symbiont of Bathyaustriella thionipta]|nr:hypothetical protein [gamma proteobacterium symbiont of Bathyaustriella thionipta]MCU7949271.1 hypothetical protein [gamma proteobacterium symbiont of Bathyaustriella thionipta]MCU7954411.1 hypothetical protein [gamma proteobacterium symbiont of Bathyaustriella thionipta]MCU7955868.1 hypothetical protein [gamma proteobacterium symbiont of Bathyaustriella thionipta]MCU7967544.1 hypothetical protein [gamma proteobacterium symbiont of Bathyaustriella thionipta]
MIHISDNLSTDQKYNVECQLRKVEGVIAPRFNKDHLLMIYFNLDKTSSSVLLNRVQTSGYQAQLVGL